MNTENKIKLTTYKMFDSNLKCRNFQYEVGATYNTDRVKACSAGFHACEFPLDCFSYYPPATSRFAEVVQSGEISKHEDDSKVASAEIYIKFEMSLPQFIGKAVGYIMAKVDWKNAQATNTGYQSATTVSGQHSVALSSGFHGKAKASLGSAIVLVYRDEYSGEILHVKAGIAGKDVEPDVFYTLDNNGNFAKTKETN